MATFIGDFTQFVPCLDSLVSWDESISPVVDGNIVTFRGTLNTTGRTVAIKRPRFVYDYSKPGVIQGASIWSLLQHENILPLFGVVTTFDNTLSTVEEWMVNGNAHDYVQNPRVDPSLLLLGIAHALRYLHFHAIGPIFHGDVRGYNVLVASDGRALLTGFDSSFAVDPAFDMVVVPFVSRGTLRWMAPEGFDGGRATAGRDAWAFAMTALELFSRQIPFANIRSTQGLIVRILRGKPDRPIRMSDKWWNICTSCWEFDPGLRPDMMAIVSKIEEVNILILS
ncbi:kinase-like domain-containing protein [Scleroderma citrinum]